MRDMNRLIVLLRVRAELPTGLDVNAGEFREGWRFVGSRGASGGEKKIRMRGWHLIASGGESPQSGLDATPQQAKSCALNRALRLLSEIFNAAKVEANHISTNPWFSQARLIVHPYLIQQGAARLEPEDALALPCSARQKRLPVNCTMVVSAVQLRRASASADLG
jgi:hypothetical protein